MRHLLCTIFLASALLTARMHAQDTLAPANEQKIFHHEFGFNTTLLLKQVFNLSNNTFTMLPYSVTYKLAWNKHALRFGLGADMNNSKTSTVNSGTSVIAGPDPVAPTYSDSYSIYFRGGWEWRFPLGRRFLTWVALDLATHIQNSASQTVVLYNNLPNYYSYSKTIFTSGLMEFGGGPAAGIQFNLSKRMSLSTEIPFYAFYSMQKDKTNDYNNYLSGSQYTITTNTSTSTITGSRFTITLPVTLYLGIRF
ncbi:MAG: hypothetical protein HY064_02815 [Bacteroidetes bacterium]|nr:hypothetical protein [Bacteroidota bacterium]